MQHRLDHIIYWTPSWEGLTPIPERSAGRERRTLHAENPEVMPTSVEQQFCWKAPEAFMVLSYT